jgi:hypothetical protein
MKSGMARWLLLLLLLQLMPLQATQNPQPTLVTFDSPGMPASRGQTPMTRPRPGASLSSIFDARAC